MATNVILRKQSSPQQISTTEIYNTSSPLSYQEWVKNNIGIIPNDADKQYNAYLVQWNSINKASPEDTINNKIREDYIALLKNLSVIFKDDEAFNRIAHIDFESQTDLKLAIPFFARKLKEIALYYIEQREKIKKSKLRYNLIGSNNALERILYENILKSFTKKDNTVHISSKEIYNNVPELSSVISDFSIEIEELYDMNPYFDKDFAISNNSTGVYGLTSTNNLLFILDDYIANIYDAVSLNEIPLSAFSNPLSEFVACETDKNLNIQVQAQLNEKYLGNDVYFLTGGYYDWDRRPVSLKFDIGNNFFYWFSGEYVRELPEGIYLDTPLSALDWTQATGTSGFDSSDIVFAWAGNDYLNGAWLSDSNKVTVFANMSATISNGKLFKFPYPGIGLSSEGITWTGKLIADTQKEDHRFFPSESEYLDTQNNIQDLYWSSLPSISSVHERYLQDTQLYNNGAFAAKSFTNADKIIVRRKVGDDKVHDFIPDEVFNGSLETSWLYKFDQTEIPIQHGVNNVYYPLTAYNTPDELFFLYDHGDSVALSSVDVGSTFAGAIAGSSINDSDILVKLNSICGPEMEAAWLRGFPLSSYFPNGTPECNCNNDDYIPYNTNWNYKVGVTQPAVSFKAQTGDFIRFVWTGPKTNLNDIKAFTGFEHDAACVYRNLPSHESILDTSFLKANDKTIFEKWKKCTCKTVNYSPLGHMGDTLMSYEYAPDFIIRDTQFPNSFSFINWRGNDNLSYTESKDLAWFKATSLLEPDVGWSAGQWKNNLNEDFYFEPGESYMYYRSNLNRCGFELPSLIINSGYCKCSINNCGDINCLPTWRKASYDNVAKKWFDTGELSDMVIAPGSFLTYTHQRNLTFSKTILEYNGNTINTISGNSVMLSAIDPNISYTDSVQTIPSINFTIKIDIANALPYWGASTFDNSYDTNNKLKMYGTADFHPVYDYLQITQPYPSKTILHDNDVIEYIMSECNNCFIWDEPLTFDVIENNRRWNKIQMDTCVSSDILNYLHEKTCEPCTLGNNSCYSKCREIDACGCLSVCRPSKIGVTATNIPSDIILNTELSGIPVFVNYFARKPLELNFDVFEISKGMPPTGGLWIPPVSASFSTAIKPWGNIINDINTIVASEQSPNLQTKKQLGLFTPNRLATGKFELHQGTIDLDYLNRTSQSMDLIRKETYADGDLYVSDTDSAWMKSTQGQGYAGNIKVDGHQTLYPYNSNSYNWGLGNNNEKFSPWAVDGTWNFEDSFPRSKTGLYPITCGPNAWYTNQHNLSGHVREWQTDVFGNQYYLIFADNTRRIIPSNKYGTLYIEFPDSTIINATQALSSIFTQFTNINFS